MLFVDEVKSRWRKEYPADSGEWTLNEKLYFQRSHLPAITHIDYTARIQTVNEAQNPLLFKLLGHFKQLTGQGVLINTSFNVRGEPIVCTPDDAYRCFLRTDMDFLTIGNFLLNRNDQNVEFIEGLKKLKMELD
jgi:carbamoyltransferase